MTDDKPGIGSGLPPWPQVDFTAFGKVEAVPLSRVQSLTAAFLHRNWLAIPHVTHHDEVDITALEAHRKALASHAEPGQAGRGKISPLAFQVKAVVAALGAFPHFNASLDESGKTLILKQYFHIGIAVDTPAGLLVAVVRDCDQKTVGEIAGEIQAVSAKAREKGLTMAEMSGGCFTISSLGGIGGTAFTPIINAPEVAILGVTKARWVATRNGDDTEWKMMLPLSLSYDHRVVNGADAARFTRHLGELLARPESL